MTLDTSNIINSNFLPGGALRKAFDKTAGLIGSEYTGKITYYIHTSGEIISTTNKDYVGISAINDEEEFLIESIFDEIDSTIDVDFNRVYSPDDATIKIIIADSIKGEDVHGFATNVITNSNNYSSEVILTRDGKTKYKGVNLSRTSATNLLGYNSIKASTGFVLLHEIYHTIGLTHGTSSDSLLDPFDNKYNTLDTLMSYNLQGVQGNELLDGYLLNGIITRNHISSNYLTQTQNIKASDLDIKAIKEIWGEEQKIEAVNIENKPTDIKLSTKYFDENIPDSSYSPFFFNENNGSTFGIVALLRTTDKDKDDNHYYNFINGNGDNDNSLFEIENNHLKIKFKPDFEKKSSYNIRIQTTDSSDNQYEKEFILNVNDKDDAPIDINLSSNKFKSNIKKGDIIGTLSTEDQTQNDSHEYKFFLYHSNWNFDDIKLKIENDKLIYWGKNWGYDNNTPPKNMSYKFTLHSRDELLLTYEKDFVIQLEDEGSKAYKGDFHDYTFINQGNGNYGIKLDSSEKIDSLTGLNKINFYDKSIDINDDIIATFDLVTGSENVTGQMFRLYNAAFARFPDSDGLKYWIGKNASGENSNRVVAESFLASDEFSERYGSNVTNEKYVETLYTNVLGRNSDLEGYNYWVGNLNNGIETRYEALLGFAESAENKALFTDMTGFG